MIKQVSKASFLWRKPVPIRRVSITAELISERLRYMRIPLPEPKGKAHAPMI